MNIRWDDLNKRLAGATILSAQESSGSEGAEIVIITTRGTIRMYHQQDCCESVYVEDIIGSLDDLVGGQIVLIEECVDPEDFCGEPDFRDESETWTFYEVRTTKGDVTIRWYGTSNGYYSESVSVTLDKMAVV